MILLAVRNDGRQPDVLYGLAFTTFQAYNNYGDRSLYECNSAAATPSPTTPRR